jgi:hypothetical protein
MHSIANNYASPSFTGTWHKNDDRVVSNQLRNRDLFIVSPFRIELFRKIRLYSLPSAWNELPDSLRYQHNGTTFKIALTDHFFDQLA